MTDASQAKGPRVAHAQGRLDRATRWGDVLELAARVLMFGAGVFLGSGLNWGSWWVWGFTGLAALGAVVAWIRYRLLVPRPGRVTEASEPATIVLPGTHMVSARVPRGLAFELTAEAAQRGVTLSEVVRDRLTSLPGNGPG